MPPMTLKFGCFYPILGKTAQIQKSIDTEMGVYYSDLDEVTAGYGTIRFTFHWPAADRSEGTQFTIEIADGS
jgi:hypothetical protein